MTDKSYAKNFWILFGIGAVLMLFVFILVAHHLNAPERVRGHRNALLNPESSVAERIRAVEQINVASAQTPRQAPRQPARVVAAKPARAKIVSGRQVYESTCVACHGAGIAGAPKVGNAALWAKRIAKGLDTLYASAINGIQGSAGVMPAKGGNTSLSNAEVKAAVDYIVAQSK
jgi:cytochrome c5